MTLIRALATRWGGGAHLAAVIASIGLLRLWDGPVPVPGRDDVRSAVVPLVPVLLALVVADGSRTVQRDLERVAAMGDRRLRVGYFVTVLVLVAVVALAGRGPDRLVLVRNGLILAGVGIGGAGLLPPVSAWPPLVLWPMVSWLLGSRGVDVPPASWALLLHPVGSVSASVAAVLAVGPALIVYLRADPPRRWP